MIARQNHSCVLVTGATGFIGLALCDQLAAAGHTVIPAVRCKSGLLNEAAVGDIGPSTDWRMALAGCDAVVHLAARVHVMGDTAQNPLALYRATIQTPHSNEGAMGRPAQIAWALT